MCVSSAKVASNMVHLSTCRIAAIPRPFVPDLGYTTLGTWYRAQRWCMHVVYTSSNLVHPRTLLPNRPTELGFSNEHGIFSTDMEYSRLTLAGPCYLSKPTSRHVTARTLRRALQMFSISLAGTVTLKVMYPVPFCCATFPPEYSCITCTGLATLARHVYMKHRGPCSAESTSIQHLSRKGEVLGHAQCVWCSIQGLS